MSLEHVQHSKQTQKASEPGKLAGQISSSIREGVSRLVRTRDSVWPTILRVTLGGVMLPHALQKTVGLFGGAGLSPTLDAFTTQLHLPMLLAVLVIFIESAGSLGLLLGLFTRAAAVGIGALMIGAVITVHLHNGFFMNWSGAQPGEGFEYHLLVLSITAALVIAGGGRGALDRFVFRALQGSP